MSSSRYYQNVIHIIGGLHGISLILTGVFVGKDNYVIGLMFATFTLLSSRISSEMEYRKQIEILKENNKING